MLKRIRPLAAIFYILDLFPGTQLYEDYKRHTGVTDDIWIKRIEDILYFETDDTLSQQAVLNFGRKLREGYFALLPQFVQQIELVDDPAFDVLHADFLSRLGMTFSHGEYAMNPLIKNGLDTAVRLFERSLDYHPDHRAFWGLGLVYQHQHRFEESIEILNQGIQHHQESVDLHMALANSLIHMDRYQEAYQRLKKFAHHPQVVDQLIRCCRFLGDRKKEQYWLGQLNRQTNDRASEHA
jgi:tetratricopeptide (TPR) repeat protein